MATREELAAKREKLLDEIASLGGMRRGSVIRQVVEDKLEDGSVIRRGPYWLYTYKEGDRTKSRRLLDEDTARRYLEEIKGFRRFEELSKDLIGVSQQMCDLEESVGTRKRHERKKKRTVESSRKSRRSSKISSRWLCEPVRRQGPST